MSKQHTLLHRNSKLVSHEQHMRDEQQSQCHIVPKKVRLSGQPFLVHKNYETFHSRIYGLMVNIPEQKKLTSLFFFFLHPCRLAPV